MCILRVSVYIDMYGCLLPLYSPLGSSTVFSVPGHTEMFSLSPLHLQPEAAILWIP